MPSTLILLKLNKELEFLKNKAEQQEDKMIEDDRIIIKKINNGIYWNIFVLIFCKLKEEKV